MPIAAMWCRQRNRKTRRERWLSSSFVGLGVFTSNKYIDDNSGWYLITAKFWRSIRNFKIDSPLTDPTAFVCGIYWQAAQASSLENIEF
ncbi:uncharacterized protein PgNI_03442 [Pyricularia grisea]|uniref:Rhamnogalacturonase A/B/Epimerase-like pectate lyase domain-containing protein n=1 Tax=Pyricularia grisea TaxID=148305 RepID=A0A6P8BDE9_PYRGI|nr:uncharacterized protein PgNI_03442 [Pyricularia grisea]TLD13843.1 hypothetical protein PgNI_03442 [Pyricularia grisea]